jgi:Leucine-rich repeat (LRR) protein
LPTFLENLMLKRIHFTQQAAFSASNMPIAHGWRAQAAINSVAKNIRRFAHRACQSGLLRSNRPLKYLKAKPAGFLPHRIIRSSPFSDPIQTH